VICPPCRTAADQHAPREQHCDDDKCMCGHRVDKYRPPTGPAVATYPTDTPKD
jgi:hypothetical protein